MRAAASGQDGRLGAGVVRVRRERGPGGTRGCGRVGLGEGGGPLDQGREPCGVALRIRAADVDPEHHREHQRHDRHQHTRDQQDTTARAVQPQAIARSFEERCRLGSEVVERFEGGLGAPESVGVVQLVGRPSALRLPGGVGGDAVPQRCLDAAVGDPRRTAAATPWSVPGG